MRTNLNGACKILRSTGLREHEVYPILNQIEKWIHNNGVEWTVGRLKEYKLGFVNFLAGKGYLPSASSWLKYNRNGPKGPFRSLTRMRKPHKALSAFMVYSAFKAKSMTNSQRKKFLDGVNHRSPEFDEDLAYQLLSSFKSLKTTKKCSFMPLRALTGKQIRIPVYMQSDWDDESGFTLKTGRNSISNILTTSKAPGMEDWIRARGRDCPDASDLYWKGETPRHMKYVGRIGFIQEPGFKMRSVANPLPIYQLALSEFGSLLYNNLRNIPEDGTFDQEKSIIEIQEYMKSGGELVAFDLSSATDTFPAEYTFLLLDRWDDVNHHDLSLWKDICRGTWGSSIGDISWKTGQPLGVFPSFAAFALTHHAVTRSVTKGFYRILGDDIVINKVDAPRLRDIYNRLGCIISETKSIDSPILTEFAGRLITKDRVYSQPKWYEISDRSFVDLARQVGPNILGLLRPRQRRIIKLLSEVPRAVHPYGMNWNPSGKPFNQRVRESEEILQRLGLKDDLIPQVSRQSKLLSDLPSRIELNNTAKAFVIHVNSDWDTDDLYEAIGRARGSVSVSEEFNPNWIESDEAQLLQFLGIHRVEGIKLLSGWFIDNSFITSDPRGVTTLSVLEKKLKHVRSPELSNLTGPA